MKLVKKLMLFVSLFGVHDVVSSYTHKAMIEMIDREDSSFLQDDIENNKPQRVVASSGCCDVRCCDKAFPLIAVAIGLTGLGGGFYYATASFIPQSHPRIYTFDNQTPASVLAECVLNSGTGRSYKELIDAYTTANFSCSSLSPIQVCSSYDDAIKCGSPTAKTNKRESAYTVSYSRLNYDNDDRFTGKLSLTPIHVSQQTPRYVNLSENEWRQLENNTIIFLNEVAQLK